MIATHFRSGSTTFVQPRETFTHACSSLLGLALETVFREKASLSLIV